MIGTKLAHYEINRCRKFGSDYARRLKKKQGRLGDIWHLDELFGRINGEQQYLWRVVDQNGDVIEGAMRTYYSRPLQRVIGGLE